MDNKKKPSANLQSQANKAIDITVKESKPFSSANSQVNLPNQHLKKCAAGLFSVKKAEVDLKELTKAQPQINLSAELFKELLETTQPQRLGVIAKCWLNDHDVHLLDEQNNIMSHFKPTEAVPAGFERARQLVLNMPAKFIALVVFTNKIEALSLNGSTEEYS